MRAIKGTRFIVAILLMQVAILFAARVDAAQSLTPAALTGRVSSQEEGAMEGVIVSAKRTGSTIRISVATDQKGNYSFPRAKLEPGEYTITSRAVGYDMEPAKVQL